jgi:hypothetical protein
MGKQDTIIEKLTFIERSTMKFDKNLDLKVWLIHADYVRHRFLMRPVFINHISAYVHISAAQKEALQ